MAMTQEQFDALVDELERRAERSPASYKLTLGAFALLGYAYVFGILLALVAVGGALAAVLIASKAVVLLKFALPIFLLIFLVLKSLWVKLEAPQGLRVTRREYPELFATIDEVRRAARAPAAHVVLITDQLNAAIVQVPRLGLLGWQKNYLVLGVPLMAMLSPDEFKAVLAHEFGHLSGAHGRFGAWIYRIRAGWARLSETLQQNRHWGSFLFVPFFNWYAPKFAAYSFVQARAQEYEADQVAARAFGAAPLSSSLVRLSLKSEELDRHYWPSVFKAADDHPLPQGGPFRGLVSTERRGFLPEAPEQLRQALQRETSTADTHPCLRDRLAALHRPADVPSEIAATAAEAIFGAKLSGLLEHFDKAWQKNVASWWRGRHEHVKQGREKLAAFANRPETDLDDVELYEYALLVEEFESVDKAFEMYRDLFVRGARQGAKFAYARLLLDRDDEAGLILLDEVMDDLPAATLPACDLIVGYLHRHGRQAEARPYIDRYRARQLHEHNARLARETIRVADKFVPHALSDESLAALKATLARHKKQVKLAYLVRKQLPEGEPPLHVVGVLRRTNLFAFERASANQKLLSLLAGEMRTGDDIVFIGLNGPQKTFIKPLKKVKGSRIA